MKTIYKYPVGTGHFAKQVSMPVGSVPLTVQLQRGTPVLWALVDADDPTEQPYYVHCVRTGRAGPPDIARLQYLGTVVTDADEVFHFFGGF